jgi:DNA-binding Xre family transcriptional regulator
MEPKLIDHENAGLAVLDALPVFAEVCATYALLHQMMALCIEIGGVDLQSLVDAATSNSAAGLQQPPSEVARAFGHALRQLCAHKDLKREQLARRALLDAQRVQEIDGGLSEPNLVELFAIAAALEMQPSELTRHFEKVSMVPRLVGATSKPSRQ